MEAARLTRRSAKGKLTRSIRTVTSLIADKRTDGELTRALELMRLAYTELSTKHENYCDLITDDVKYDEAEDWMEECRATVLSSEVAITEYLGTVLGKGDIILDTSEGNEQPTCHRTESMTQSGYQADRNTSHVGNVIGTTENLHGTTGLDNQKTSVHETITGTPQANRNILGSSTSKLKKDFIPKFDGNVREYGIFRADFKHVVERTCDDRDAITVLRSCVSGKPAELIRGITNDYKAAWEYLDSVYGDPRYVSDAVTHDIASFPCLHDGEDVRFCDFVHLLRRSYSTLKELERPEDMNNNHMLALVEQKLCNEDRKVWARHLVHLERRATFEELLRWMKSEMEARMRSSAPLRTAVQSDNVVCNAVASDYTYSQSTSTYGYTRDTCWICRSCDHWVDQCEVLRQMSPQERLQLIQDNNACLCCMKLASRNHTTDTCYRRRECSVMSGGQPCNMYHHPLLHSAINCSSVGVAALATNTVILPVLSVRALGVQARSIVANTLFDSGAQISLIRTEVATKLGLKGRHLTISLKKVGGHAEEIHTKEYTVALQSLETRKTYDVKVIAIPCINEDVCEVTVLHRMVEQLKIGGPHVNRKTGPVDILIGIDHAHLHVGETRQGVGGVVARHSPLGWILFGSSTREHSGSAVLHVGVNTKPDITDISMSKPVGSPRAHSCVNRNELQEEKRYMTSDLPDDLPDKKQQLREKAVKIFKKTSIKVDDTGRINAKNYVRYHRNRNNNTTEVRTTLSTAHAQGMVESVKNADVDSVADACSDITKDDQIKDDGDHVTLIDDVVRGLGPPECSRKENCHITVPLTDTVIDTDIDEEFKVVINTMTRSAVSAHKSSFSAFKNLVFAGAIILCITTTIICMTTQCICVCGKYEEIISNRARAIRVRQYCALVLGCDSGFRRHSICTHRKKLRLFTTDILRYNNGYLESTTIGKQTAKSTIYESITSLENKRSIRTILATMVEKMLNIGSSCYTQLQKQRGTENSNTGVSARPAGEAPWEPKPSRVMMLSLTDGVTDIHAIEYTSIPQLTPTYTPGFKVLLFGTIMCRRGVLFLTPDNLQILGGEVDALNETHAPVMVLETALSTEPPANSRCQRRQFSGRMISRGDNSKMAAKMAGYKMAGYKMGGTKMGGTKMGGTKMAGGTKMGGTKMAGGTKMGGTKMGGNKMVPGMSGTKMAAATMTQQNRGGCGTMMQGKAMGVVKDMKAEVLQQDLDMMEDDDFFDDMDVEQFDAVEISNTNQQRAQTNSFSNNSFSNNTTQNFQNSNNNFSNNQHNRNNTKAPVAQNRQNQSIPKSVAQVKPNNSQEFDDFMDFDDFGDDMQPPSKNKRKSTLSHEDYGNKPQSPRLDDNNDRQAPTNQNLSNRSSIERVQIKTEPNFTDDIQPQNVLPNISSTTTTRHVIKTESHNQSTKSRDQGIDFGGEDFTDSNIDDTVLVVKSEESRLLAKVKTSLANSDPFSREPFTYLCLVDHSLSSNVGVIFKIKGYISTLMGKLVSSKSAVGWTLPVRLNDGTSTIDVHLSDSVLADMIGFTSHQCLELRRAPKENPEGNFHLQKAIKDCQQRLINLSCIFELNIVSPKTIIVTSIEPIARHHVLALQNIVQTG